MGGVVSTVDNSAFGLPVAKFLNKVTFGTVAGKYDPIGTVFQIRESDIQGRIDAEKAAKNPKQATGGGTQTKVVQRMEARQDHIRSRASAASVALANEDKDLLSSTSRQKGRRTTGAASKRLGG